MAVNEKYFKVKNGLVAPEITSASLSVESDIFINNESISSTFLRKDTASSQYLTFASASAIYYTKSESNNIFLEDRFGPSSEDSEIDGGGP